MQHNLCCITYDELIVINRDYSHFTNGLVEVNVESDATLLKNRKVRPSAEFIRNIADNGFQDSDSFENQVEGSDQSWFRQVSDH